MTAGSLTTQPLQVPEVPLAEEALGPGKRKQWANMLYKAFWRHHDNDDSDEELEGSNA